MEKHIKENAGFYAMGIIAIIIAVLGITANTIYSHSGGYALGAGLVAVAFLFECFVFSISPKLVKTRTKGILLFTASILTIYTILFIFGDLANIRVYKSVYTDGLYSSKLQPFGVFALVFEVFCLILTVFFVSRMLLNLFGKEFKLYEKLLGTTVLRYKERDKVELDLPQKDTDKLVASAKRALGHDDKLTKAIENAKPEEEDSKNKTPLVRNVNEKRINDVKKNSTSNESVVNERITASVEITENGQAESDNEYLNFDYEDETLVSAERFFSENNVSVDDKDASENKTDESLQNDELLSAPLIVSEDEKELSNDEVQDNENESVDTAEIQPQTDEINYDVSGTGELYADSNDVGGVLSEFEIHEDIRKDGVSNRITEQVENPDDDIYGLFDYDSDDE